MRDALDLVDPDEWNAERARRARERAERRARRRDRRARPDRGVLGSRWGRALSAAVALLVAATLVGLALLWPGDVRPTVQGRALGGPTGAAVATAARDVPCGGPTAQRCRRIEVRLADGRDRGRKAAIMLGPVGAVSKIDPGTKVRVSRAGAAPGAG